MARVSVKERKRIWFSFILFLIGMSVVIIALANYQLIQGKELKEKAIEQQTRDTTVEAKRGSIYDRNMKVLAQSAACSDVMVNPRRIRELAKDQQSRREKAEKKGKEFNEKDIVENIVTTLSEILEVDPEFVREQISYDKASRRIKAKVQPSVVQQIRDKKLKGVFFEETTKRHYPYSSFASHVIGFVRSDGVGLEGLERMLDDTLSGTSGRIQVVQDVINRAIPSEYENYIPEQNGNGVVLTIDEVIQHYAEKYLEEAYELYDIKNGGAAIVMNPNTGEVLAMAIAPSFDLNDPRVVDKELMKEFLGEYKEDGTPYTDTEYLTKLWRNKAVIDVYEPGSTFKSIVAAAAIESGVVNVNSDMFHCTGKVWIGKEDISCHKTSGHGEENFVQILENSCNPAFIELGSRLGNTRFREYFEAFGFGSKTGFVIPGESKGIFFSEERFNQLELATSSFGQGFSVTPLQLISAFSAVVNGGKLMKPQLIKAYTDSEGNVVKSVETEMVRSVISENTSRIMRSALESVVANGTGKGAYVEGYRIGGKTGTSEKIPRGQKKYVASFIGFAPADDPQLVCLVILDEPGGALTGGGAIAAPAAGKILADSLEYLGYEPKYAEEEVSCEVPNLVGKTTWDAKTACINSGLSVSIQGEGAKVTNQLPKAGSRLPEGDTVILYTEAVVEEKVSMPDFIGMTKPQAEALAKELKLNIKIAGGGESGEVTDMMLAVGQSTPAGTMVLPGSIVTVEFVENFVEYIHNTENMQQ